MNFLELIRVAGGDPSELVKSPEFKLSADRMARVLSDDGKLATTTNLNELFSSIPVSEPAAYAFLQLLSVMGFGKSCKSYPGDVDPDPNTTPFGPVHPFPSLDGMTLDLWAGMWESCWVQFHG